MSHKAVLSIFQLCTAPYLSTSIAEQKEISIRTDQIYSIIRENVTTKIQAVSLLSISQNVTLLIVLKIH